MNDIGSGKGRITPEAQLSVECAALLDCEAYQVSCQKGWGGAYRGPLSRRAHQRVGGGVGWTSEESSPAGAWEIQGEQLSGEKGGGRHTKGLCIRGGVQEIGPVK